MNRLYTNPARENMTQTGCRNAEKKREGRCFRKQGQGFFIDAANACRMENGAASKGVGAMNTIKVGVLYGKGSIEFEIPEKNLLQVIEPRHVPGLDIGETVTRALQNPIGSPGLKELTRDKKNILIITSDNTRPVPSCETLPAILSQFYHEESFYNITILIATGLHRAMTREEIAQHFSEALANKYRFVNHDATCRENLVCLGEMSTGNTLWVNRLVTESDLVIAEGFIEPHFFAGFSGGRKSILPGVSGADTILYNHRPENIASPFSVTGNLRRNPIHEECEEAARLAGLDFIMNVALNRDKQVIAAFAGDPVRAHAAGCEFVMESVSVPARPADIVISSNNGYPLDRNIYQAVKGMDAASRAVRKGGTIILAAQCFDKNGNNEFERLIFSCASPAELLEKTSAGASEADKWQAQVFARIISEYRVVLLSDNVSRQTAEKMFMRHAGTPGQALDIALELEGSEAKINVIPEGPVVIPVIKE